MKQIGGVRIPQKLINLLWHKPRALAAACMFGFPWKRLTVIGIAGTKGKTSTAYILSHILDNAGYTNALISTAALKIAGQESPNALKMTSPDVFFLNRFLRDAIKQGCTYAVLEVSSHAIDQYRVWGIPFSLLILTNLHPDHLEYHETAEEYQSIHKRIVSSRYTTLILNGDEITTRKFRATPKQKIFFTHDGLVAQALAKASIPLLTSFQKINIIAAATAAYTLSLPIETITKSLQSLTAIPGRCEYINAGQSFKVIVDYAHSPLSLQTFFGSLRETHRGPIITVFGACGERDEKTRAPMGTILDQFSDTIIVTNDDPYSEDPEKIAHDLMVGVTKKQNGTSLFKILDRREAIKKAFTLAAPDMVVCILGKGAEQLQVFKDTKMPWDDRSVARETLKDVLAQIQKH